MRVFEVQHLLGTLHPIGPLLEDGSRSNVWVTNKKTLKNFHGDLLGTLWKTLGPEIYWEVQALRLLI